MRLDRYVQEGFHLVSKAYSREFWEIELQGKLKRRRVKRDSLRVLDLSDLVFGLHNLGFLVL